MLLEDLPSEILIDVISHLSSEDILGNVSLASRRLYEVSRDQMLWKNRCMPSYIAIGFSPERIESIKDYRKDYIRQLYIDSKVRELLLDDDDSAVVMIPNYGVRAKVQIKRTINEIQQAYERACLGSAEEGEAIHSLTKVFYAMEMLEGLNSWPTK